MCMKIAVILDKIHFWNYFDFIWTWNNRQTKNIPVKIQFHLDFLVKLIKEHFTFIQNEQGYCEMSRENASAYRITKILQKEIISLHCDKEQVKREGKKKKSLWKQLMSSAKKAEDIMYVWM